MIYTFAVVFADVGRRLSLRRLAQQAADAPLLASAASSCCAREGLLRGIARHGRAPAPPMSSARPSSAQRSRLRWWMHQLLFWGCLLAVAITFPLVFGWIHFGSRAGRPDDLRHVPVRLPGRLVPDPHGRLAGCSSTASTSPPCWCWRASRSRSGGACATAARSPLQDFAHGLLPAASCCSPSRSPGSRSPRPRSGCAAAFYGFLAILHAITVIGALLYLPVRQVLPHLPAAGAAGRQALPGRRATRTRARSAPAAASASPRACTSTTSSACCPSSASTTG